MDTSGTIYELTDGQKNVFMAPEITREKLELEKDVARLEGYLKGRAEEAKLHPNRDLSKCGSHDDN